MNKLIIFDYHSHKIHFYNIEKEVVVDEEYISSLGYNEMACYWVVGNFEAVHHKGILK